VKPDREAIDEAPATVELVDVVRTYSGASGEVRALDGVSAAFPPATFTVAMFAIRRIDDYLFWVWLPTIVAGVLFGSILDHAHKRYPDG